MMRSITLILLVCCCVFGSARAQNLYSGNPADPALLESMFSNPALNAYIRDRLAVALTAHQVGVADGGFLGLRSGIITYHLPWQFRGAAAGVQFMSAGLYSQNQIRLSYGSRAWGPFRAGANLDIIARSFDRSKFYNVDLNDPLLQGGTDKTIVSLGGGITVEPYRSFTIGLALQNLNRPDVAMGSDPFHLPMSISLGIRLQLQGASVSSGMNALPVRSGSPDATSDAASAVPDYTRLGLEVPIGRFLVRASTDANESHIEGEAPLYGNLYFNYRYAYPQSEINAFSSGTSRFGFIYDFNRLAPLSPLPKLPKLISERTEITPLAAEPRGFYYVYADADSVSITQLHVNRNIDSDIAAGNLGLLFPEDLGNLRAAQHPVKLREVSLLDVRDPQARLKGLYSPQYRSAIEGIAFQMKGKDSTLHAEVISFPGAERRANAIVNLMTGDRIAISRPVPIMTTSDEPAGSEAVNGLIGSGSEDQLLMTPERVNFHLIPVSSSAVKSWRFEIRNPQEVTVKDFAGNGTPPESLVWEWQNPGQGDLAGGLYSYALKTVDEVGRPSYSSRGVLNVVHRHQSLSIDVTRRQKVGTATADKYILILGADPRTGGQLPTDGGK